MDYEELKGKKLKDEELTKLYVNTLQVYDDQLSIMELIITKSAESRKVLFPVRICTIEDIQAWSLWDSDLKLDLAQEIREYYIPDFSNWKDHDAFTAEFEKLLNDLRQSEKR